MNVRSLWLVCLYKLWPVFHSMTSHPTKQVINGDTIPASKIPIISMHIHLQIYNYALMTEFSTHLVYFLLVHYPFFLSGSADWFQPATITSWVIPKSIITWILLYPLKNIKHLFAMKLFLTFTYLCVKYMAVCLTSYSVIAINWSDTMSEFQFHQALPIHVHCISTLYRGLSWHSGHCISLNCPSEPVYSFCVLTPQHQTLHLWTSRAVLYAGKPTGN